MHLPVLFLYILGVRTARIDLQGLKQPLLSVEGSADARNTSSIDQGSSPTPATKLLDADGRALLQLEDEDRGGQDLKSFISRSAMDFSSSSSKANVRGEIVSNVTGEVAKGNQRTTSPNVQSRDVLMNEEMLRYDEVLRKKFSFWEMSEQRKDDMNASQREDYWNSLPMVRNAKVISGSLMNVLPYSKVFHDRVTRLYRQYHYTSWRPIRGDGACLYRSLGFNLLEQLAQQMLEEGWVLKFLDKFYLLKSSYQLQGDKDDHDAVTRLIENFRRFAPMEAMKVLEGAMKDSDTPEDRGLVRAMRHFTASHLSKQAAKDADLRMICTAFGYQDCRAYVAGEILPMDSDADDIALNHLSAELEIIIRSVRIDPQKDFSIQDRGDEAVLARKAEGEKVPIVHALLKQGGHYDVIYQNPELSTWDQIVVEATGAPKFSVSAALKKSSEDRNQTHLYLLQKQGQVHSFVVKHGARQKAAWIALTMQNFYDIPALRELTEREAFVKDCADKSFLGGFDPEVVWEALAASELDENDAAGKLMALREWAF